MIQDAGHSRRDELTTRSAVTLTALIALYCGVPAANSAFKVAPDVFAGLDAAPDAGETP